MAAVAATQSEKACVQVESATWVSDARDLFDYEIASARTRDFDLPSSAKITRVGTSLMPLERHEPLPHGGEALLQLSKQGDGFWVDSAAPSTGSSGAKLGASKKLWLVVKDLAAPYALSEGDVIRMGCSRFRVRQLVANPDSGVRPDVTLPDSATICSPCEDPDTTGTACRICLEGGDDDELGPLIQPCACKGSVQSVHMGCLQQWINCRLGLMDNGRPEAYFVGPLDCDLCKRPYPSHVVADGGCRRPLVQVPQPNGPFIVLEMLARSRNSASSGVLVGTVADEEKPLTFGRAHNVGFKVDDISMSRCHAKICFRRGQFFLEDNRSRFGTLVCMRRPYALSPGAAVSIQCGSTVLSLTLKHDGAPPVSCLREDVRDHCSECSTEDDVSA